MKRFNHRCGEKNVGKASPESVSKVGVDCEWFACVFWDENHVKKLKFSRIAAFIALFFIICSFHVAISLQNSCYERVFSWNSKLVFSCQHIKKAFHDFRPKMFY